MRGSVHRRGAKWRAVVDVTRGEGGERRQKTATFSTRRAADQWIARHMLAGPEGSTAARRLSVEAYFGYYLEQVEPSLKAGTRRSYQTALARWTPLIGDASLAKLTPLGIQEALAHLAGMSLAPTTVRASYATLRTALRQAMAWGLLEKDPTAGVKRPRCVDPEMRYWCQSEAARFIGFVNGKTRYDALYVTALTTGVRGGELCALRWDDVVWDRCTVRIARSLSWPSGEPPVVTDPKTYSSRRTIDLDANTLRLLRSHRGRQAQERLRAGAAWEHPELVFSTRTGGYLRQADLDHAFARLARGAGVPAIRFHDLRHTHATLLLADGRGVKEVADRLGHHDPAMTLRRYAHVLPDRRSQSAESIGRALFGSL